MQDQVVVAVGTAKGLFLYRSDAARCAWTLSGPHLKGWEVTNVLLEPRPAGLRILAATLAWSYGATIRESLDGGETWTLLEGRPAYPEGSPYKLNRIWQLARGNDGNGTLYAGVDEAGLFVSHDDARSWSLVESLTADPHRPNWFPGGGGLCLHTIVTDHSNPDRMWVGISAVGVFRTLDRGRTWARCNVGLRVVAGEPNEPSPPHCVHKIVQHPRDPDTLFMQYHGGVYVSRDAGDSWTNAEHGLPGNFGFPMVVTRSGRLFITPLESDENRVFKNGQFAVYRSDDDAASWQPLTRGLPKEPSFSGVLRDAMATDRIDGRPEGVYLGTTSGDVYASSDEGEQWQRLPGTFPRILTVRAVSV